MIARSLTARLALAFVLTGLASIALVGVFARSLAGADFERFLFERERDAYVELAAEYYREFGTWQGFDSAAGMRRLQPGQAYGRPAIPPGQALFVLANTDGVLVTRGGSQRPGSRIAAETLAGGTPVIIDGTHVGTVITIGRAAERSQREREFLARIDKTLVYASIGGATLALITGIVLARLLTRPITDLTAAIGAMRSGAFNQQVRTTSKDEIGVLVQAFNEMSADLAQANTARRRMTADIAHELNTPLSVLSGYLEGMRDGVLEPTRERFEIMYGEAGRLQRLIGDLRLLSLAEAGELTLHRELLPPRNLLSAAAAAFQPQAERQQQTLLVAAGDDLPDIAVDRERMLQVLGNLISNALRYTPAGGQIT
ncbi:MAG TPA: histidine kinase dimerization/phospho-acceptor domain-containing protein, partial [Roseiflexaceae bacterium]|nr:histidine kinase dimerization/phospho-acceptor domain-containing protein [Roseiflexaceae bacterium]